MMTGLTRTVSAAALAAAALAITAPGAHALKFEFVGFQAGSVGVNYTRTAPPGPANIAGSALAGAFTFKDVTNGTSGPLGTFIAWCFDLDTSFSSGQKYDYNLSSGLLGGTPPYLAGAAARIQSLFDAAYDISGVNSVLSSADRSAGFQLAIWEVLYDSNYSLATGSFLTTSSGAAVNAGQAFLNAANGFMGSQRWTIATYDSYGSPLGQDVGVAAPVPLPAAAWMLVGVAGALVAAKRRSLRGAA
jgi:hypothetical protein